MYVGDVITKHRKGKNMTQEEMAKRLGVTAPAVNKWEKGHSLPDVTLLSPIARLLNISIDTLLCHETELSDEQANRFVTEAHERLKAEPFDAVFEWVKQILSQYPNCHFLILCMARLLDSHLQMTESSNRARYDACILDCYKRVLESESEPLRNPAAEALYYFYMAKEDYSLAEEFLGYFSQGNPERKRMQAMIYSHTDRQAEAYKMYEELLYSGYQSLSMTLNNACVMALKDNDRDKACMLRQKMQKLASLFEFGEYHEVSPGLELAMLEKDVDKTLHIAQRMLTNLESIAGFTQSPLYAHMEFKPIDEAYFAEVRQGLLEAFRCEETYAFMSDNPQWHALMGL